MPPASPAVVMNRVITWTLVFSIGLDLAVLAWAIWRIT